jgi:hypothetical protein
MHIEAVETGTQCLKCVVEYVERQMPFTVLPHVVWEKTAHQTWSGSIDEENHIFISPMNDEIQAICQPFQEALERHHSDHVVPMGCSAFGLWHMNAARYLIALVREAWPSLKSEGDIDDVFAKLVAKLSRYVDNPNVDISITVPLANLVIKGTFDELNILDAWVIREVSEDEAQMIYGGLPVSAPKQIQPQEFHNYVLTRDYSESKMWKTESPQQSPEHDEILNELSRIRLALRTYTDGPIGFDGVYFRQREMCNLFGVKAISFQREYIPIGRYLLQSDELENLSKHVDYFKTKECVFLTV